MSLHFTIRIPTADEYNSIVDKQNTCYTKRQQKENKIQKQSQCFCLSDMTCRPCLVENDWKNLYHDISRQNQEEYRQYQLFCDEEDDEEDEDESPIHIRNYKMIERHELMQRAKMSIMSIYEIRRLKFDPSDC